MGHDPFIDAMEAHNKRMGIAVTVFAGIMFTLLGVFSYLMLR